MQAELEYTLEEIKDICKLMENENNQEEPAAAEDLELRKARGNKLKNKIAREEGRLALFESERAWVPGDTRNMAIGQGNILATPLQMARLVAVIANGGRLLRPHLRIEHGKDYLERELPVSPGSLRAIREAMHEVVFGKQGTARQKELQRHDVAAKTGTAELGGEWNNGWIVGFAPYGAPRISFAVVVEHTKYHGGEVAGPLLAKILDAYFGTD